MRCVIGAHRHLPPHALGDRLTSNVAMQDLTPIICKT
jgi:hypothetical protein